MDFQILKVSAAVLADLCVSYIMTSQNEEVTSTSFTGRLGLCQREQGGGGMVPIGGKFSKFQNQMVFEFY